MDIIRIPDITERIRRAPDLFFSSEETEGSIGAVKELLDIFFTEAVMGYCNKIAVKIGLDGSIEIFSSDRGIKLDDAEINGKPSWFYIFCKPAPSPREAEDYLKFLKYEHNRLYGEEKESTAVYEADENSAWQLCCVQCTSIFMTVEAVRDGVKKTLHFKDGYSVGDMEKTYTQELSSTKIHFKPDDTVFGDTTITPDKISRLLRAAAVTIPGLRCTLEDERNAVSKAYFFGNGIADYAVEKAGSRIHTPVFTKEITATGKDRSNQQPYDARVKVALAFSDSSGHTECFHNYSPLKLGGDHQKEAEEKILSTVNWYICEDEEAAGISAGKLKDRLILIIETNCSRCATKWSTARKTYITNAMITDMCADLFKNDFDHFVKENAELIRSITL